MRIVVKHSFTAAAIIGLIACGGDSEETRRAIGHEITREMYGPAWPFTVDRVTLKCGDAALNHVVVESGGVTYALNGSARGSAQVREGRWKDTDPILAKDPAKVGSPAFDRPFVLVPSELIQRGLEICKAG